MYNQRNVRKGTAIFLAFFLKMTTGYTDPTTSWSPSTFSFNEPETGEGLHIQITGTFSDGKSYLIRPSNLDDISGLQKIFSIPLMYETYFKGVPPSDQDLEKIILKSQDLFQKGYPLGACTAVFTGTNVPFFYFHILRRKDLPPGVAYLRCIYKPSYFGREYRRLLTRQILRLAKEIRNLSQHDNQLIRQKATCFHGEPLKILWTLIDPRSLHIKEAEKLNFFATPHDENLERIILHNPVPSTEVYQEILGLYKGKHGKPPLKKNKLYPVQDQDGIVRSLMWCTKDNRPGFHMSFHVENTEPPVSPCQH